MMRLEIEKNIQGALGLAHIDGKAVLVEGALAGEVVEAEITEDKKDFSRAVTGKILVASPDRVAPVCPYYGRCGGCDFMHASFEAQLRIKEECFRETMLRLAGISDSSLFRPIVYDEPFGYRSRARFLIDNGCYNFRARSSDRPVPVDFCPVLTPGLNRLLSKIPNVSGKELSVTENPIIIKGKQIAAGDDVFFQSNRPMLEKLLDVVIPLAVGKTAVDLYSGVGVFASFLEDAGFDVTAVERDPRCLAYARLNLTRSKFYTGSVENLKARKFRCDTLVVDPPRVGLERNVPALIASFEPERIIYVSCNPTTQARDIGRFAAFGYRPVLLQPFEFYPNTAHLEAIAVMSKV